MRIAENTVEDIKAVANLVDVVGSFVPLTKKGKDFQGDCPFCGAKKKFSVNRVKEIYKCWICGAGGKGSIAFVMDKCKMDFPEALKFLADKFNIIIQEEKAVPILPGNLPSTTFRDLQLQGSGLDPKDQKDLLRIDDKTEVEIDRYQSGSVNENWDLIPGDDMVMHYLDLQGERITYPAKGKGKDLPLMRIRYQNPEHHKSKDGKPRKYSQPYGSRSALWINHWIRNKYRNKIPFETLFIQEGEKKADKATKHGILSVGIMGINNLGYNNMLPMEFDLIIRACNVKNVCLVFDSDWKDLGGSGPVDQRAKSFLTALKNYHDYFYSFNNVGIHLNIFFAAVKKNQANEKGIDDLLSGSLRDREKDLLEEFNKGMLEKSPRGEFVDLYKIGGKTEYQLKQYLHLESPQAFMEYHKEKLQQRGTFLIGRYEWRWNQEEKKFELAHPLNPDEEYWKEETFVNRYGNEITKHSFNYENCYNLLKNRKFGRYGSGPGKFKFIRIGDDKVVTEIEPYQIKDFVVDFTKQLGNSDVLNMLYRGAKMYLGPDSLSNLEFIQPEFHRSARGIQYLYFKNTYWKITQDGIEVKPLKELPGHVWDKKIIDFDGKALEDPLFTVTRDENGIFDIEANEQALQCDFFNFIRNTSNFYHDKKESDQYEAQETVKHMITKICATGYLLHQYRDSNILKAVVCMDGKQSEVGSSNGRTGKSLLGTALEKVIPVTYIPGKKKDLTEDRFIWEEVDERTQLIFLDDVRVNLDFEFFFPVISGKMQVEVKGVRKNTLPAEQTPKLLITTNHALNGDGASFRDRQILLAFSDYYSDKRRPVDDFKHLFFDEWDYNQWNLFYNFMACCLQVYFQYGIIEANVERLNKRRLRQLIGEDFMDWANLFFEGMASDESGQPVEALGNRILKNTMYENLIAYNPNIRKYTSIRDFKRRMIHYCEYKGYILNPGKPKDGKSWGGDDKTGGKEFFLIKQSEDF